MVMVVELQSKLPTAKKLFRCMNPKCQALNLAMGRFWAEASETNPAVCPQCKIVGKANTKFGHLIVRLTIVHFDPPSEIPGIGLNVRACDQDKIIQVSEGGNGIPNHYHVGSGSVRAVNCPACQASEAYQQVLRIEQDEDAPSQAEAAFERIKESALSK